jgi:heterodisulfide reductase subunit B
VKLSYYPGCSLTGSSREYDHSIREVAGLLDIELAEIRDWNCCGASSAHMTDHQLAVELSARNLLLAQPEGRDILVPCAACFQRLRCGDQALHKDPGRFGISNYQPGFKVVHITPLLSRPDFLDKLRKKVTRPLSGLKVACYYGCLSLRPPAVTGVERYEDPRGLDLIAEALGLEPKSWSHKTECCSGSLTMAKPEIARALVGDIVKAAAHAGAQALVVDCPMCQANLETRQSKDSRLPVFFATELMALAMTGKSTRKQWKKHMVDPRPLLGSVGFR